MIAIGALAILAASFQHLPAIYCREFSECLAQLPQGKIVAATVFLDDINDYAAMNLVYEKRFPGLKPARNTVSTRLPGNFRMAINAIAYQGTQEPKGLTPPNVTNLVPITPGIVAGDRLFIAGILGRDSNSGNIPKTAEAQIDMCLARLTRVLATANLTPMEVVQATAYHRESIPRALIDQKLKLYFGPQPVIAITILEVTALALGANIGLNGIASFLPTGG